MGRNRDELYYFFNGSYLYHGEKIWSSYHKFIHQMTNIPISEYIDQPSWFAGSRPNYTHQLVDFLPNILLLNDISQRDKHSRDTLVIGRSN